MTTRKSSRNRRIPQKMSEYNSQKEKDKKFKKGVELSNVELCEMCGEYGGTVVRCDSCALYYHLSCLDIDEDELMSSGSWTCAVCNGDSKERSSRDMSETSDGPPKRAEGSGRKRPSYEIEDEYEGYYVEKDMTLAQEISQKYRIFNELVSTHNTTTFKRFNSKTLAQKTEIMERCQDELQELMEDALYSDKQNAVPDPLGPNVPNDVGTIFSQFLSWQRLMKLIEIMPTDDLTSENEAIIPKNLQEVTIGDKINETEIVDVTTTEKVEAEENKINESKPKDMKSDLLKEQENTETKETDTMEIIENTEPKETEINETKVNETEKETKEPKETEINETEVNETEIKENETKEPTKPSDEIKMENQD